MYSSMSLSAYELSRLDNMAQNARALEALGLVREARQTQTRRRAQAPKPTTQRRSSERRGDASLRRYDTMHLFGHDAAAWPLPGVRRSHSLLVVRLALRGQAVPRARQLQGAPPAATPSESSASATTVATPSAGRACAAVELPAGRDLSLPPEPRPDDSLSGSVASVSSVVWL